MAAAISREEISTHLNADVELGDDPVRICPGTLGGADWNGPAFDTVNRQVLVNSVDWCATFKRQRADQPGRFGGSVTFDLQDLARGWLGAFDAAASEPRWSYQARLPMLAGVIPTAGA